MTMTNVIVNGTFDSGSTGWSGTDLETKHKETAYLGNGSSNRVAEMDGTRSQVTVMEQTFTVVNPLATELTLDTALRTSSLSNAGSDGFTIEILDASGSVIATQTVLPTSSTYVTVTLPVTFPAAGDYTLRFTEVGPNDSLGAIVDNIELLVCFAGDTEIKTLNGTKRATDIQVGDLIETDCGPKPVRWIGRRKVLAEQIEQEPKYSPVRISAGALGQGLPRRDILVSRQHRMLVSSPICMRMFGDDSVIVSAIKLTELPGIYVDDSVSEIEYVHLLFDQHEIVFAEGAPTESLLLGTEAKASLTEAAMDEIGLIFPDVPEKKTYMSPVRRIPSGKKQKKMIERLIQNKRPVLEHGFSVA